MKITRVTSIPLMGETPPGGWAHEIAPEDNVHTLIKVETDEGLIGWGSSFTSKALVDGALQLLRPMLIGECAIEPERVSEKLHQFTFWQGRGGAVTHAISGMDIALWDIPGQPTNQPIARRLGANNRTKSKPHRPLLSSHPPTLKTPT